MNNGPDTTPPTQPGTLTATAVSGSEVDLSWGASTDNVGVTGYQVERCQGTGCTNFAQIARPPAPAPPTRTPASAPPPATATASAPPTPPATSAPTRTPPAPPPPHPTRTPPTQPGTLTATAVSGGEVDLSWGASTDNVGVTGYQVERCQGSGCTNFAQIATPTGTQLQGHQRQRRPPATATASAPPTPPATSAPTRTPPAPPPPLPRPVWSRRTAFDEGSGTTVADASGNGHTGTITERDLGGDRQVRQGACSSTARARSSRSPTRPRCTSRAG